MGTAILMRKSFASEITMMVMDMMLMVMVVVMMMVVVISSLNLDKKEISR